MYRQIGMWDQKWVIGNWKMNGRLQNSNALMHRFRIHPTAERVLSFFGRGEERFVINDPAIVQCYGLAFFQTAFPLQPPLPQECVCLGFKSSALGVLDAPAFLRRSR